MPFPFINICKFLESLEDILINRDVPLLRKERDDKIRDVYNKWFRHYCQELNSIFKDDHVITWTLKPETLVERDYQLDEARLRSFIARTFQMRHEDFLLWRSWEAGGKFWLGEPIGRSGVRKQFRNDLGDRVERIMKHMKRDDLQSVRFGHKEVSVQEIDNALIIIAAQNPGSSANVRYLKRETSHDRNCFDSLEQIYLKLSSREAKWLTRLILKDYGFKVPTSMVLGAEITGLPRMTQAVGEIITLNLIPVRRVILDNGKIDENGFIMGYGPLEVQKSAAAISKSSSKPAFSSAAVSHPELEREAVASRAPLGESAPSVLNSQSSTHRSSPKSPLNQPASASNTTLRVHKASRTRARKSLIKSVSPPRLRKDLLQQRGKKSPEKQPLLERVQNYPNTPDPTPCRKTMAPEGVSFSGVQTSPNDPNTTLDAQEDIDTPISPPSTDNESPEVGPSSHIQTSPYDLYPIPPNSSQSPPTMDAPTPGPHKHHISHHKLKIPNSITRTITLGTNHCTLTPNPNLCPLRNSIFILPSHLPHRTTQHLTTLLKSHGCTYLSSLSPLTHPRLIPRGCKTSGKRFRRIALVDNKMRDEMMGFMRDIEGLRLKRGGRKDWTEVFDWRLVEGITMRERGGSLRGSERERVEGNVWRKYWIGAV